MANMMNGTMDVTNDADGNFTDEYGDRWIYVADDMRSHYAVDREDGGAAGVVVVDRRDGSAVLYASRDGETFDCDAPASYIVKNDGWERNED